MPAHVRGLARRYDRAPGSLAYQRELMRDQSGLSKG